MRARSGCTFAVLLAVTSGSAAAPLPDVQIRVSRIVANGFVNPLLVTNAGDGSGRLFVVEQRGVVWVVDHGVVRPAPFLDLRGQISSGGERGLLGLAFHPDYESNGLFYASYTDPAGTSILARYNVSASDANVADPSSAQTLLTVAQPFANHNGGHVAFGPLDLYLYMGLGDGGSGNDPFNHGQDIGTLLGSILRLDVDGGFPYAVPPDNPFVSRTGADEIWAFGLRNPWRFAFDRDTGDLYIGDVGQGIWEEIDFQAAGTPGGVNFGWNIREGPCPRGGRKPCAPAPAPLVDPIAHYDHSVGVSVTGGYVYRGTRFPALRGRYFYADFGTGLIFSIYPTGPGAWSNPELELSSNVNISSFGEDEEGELYVVDYYAGSIRLLEDVVNPPVILSQELPKGFFGIGYEESILAGGGTPPYSFSLVSGSLAPGLFGPSAATGTISGTPSQLGTFGPFTLRVTDATSRFDDQVFNHTIALGPPVPMAPLGGTPELQPEFSWSATPGATSYQLVLEELPGGAAVVDVPGISATTFVPATPLVSGKSYRWRVRAGNGADFSDFSSNVSFDVDTTPPAASLLTAAPPTLYGALAATAIASSGDFDTTTYARSKVTDGSPATLWSSPARMMLQNEFLVLDLGTAKTIGRVRMRSRTGTGATFPRDFQIQASFDNVSFTTVSTTTGFTAPAGAEFSFPFPPTVARYVKVLSTRVAAYTDGKFYTQIAEIGVDQASPAPAALAITWIAPGDDGNAGRASSYDLRFSPAPILDASAFGTATPVPGVPSPGPSGSAESVVLTGLSQESRYHFALRTTDDAGNVSPLSPPANGVTKGIAPSPVTDLTASNPTLGSIELHWTATGDDGGSGTASAYAVRYSRSPLTEGNFDSAVPVTSGVPSPSPSGTAEAMTVTGLSSTTTYYFAVRVLDEAGNRSLLSNVAVASTLDDTPPGKVTDLSGFTGSLTEQRIAASVIASSGVASADYGIGKVVDGHLLTSWSTPGRTPQPEFLTLDTGAVRALSRIRLRSRDVGTLFPEDYQIQVSLDGASWTTALTLTGINLPAAAWIEHAFPPTTGRYLRLFVTKARRYSANLLYYVQIAEIEVFEAQVGAGAITLHWTAPGDDENLGTATSYSLERSTASDFSTSTLVSTAAPNAAGMVESLVVSGLSDETRYYFRLSATDDSSNVSELSNVARVDTAGTAPSAVSDLSATPRTGRRIALSWTATGDDGTTGTATRYDLRYSTSPIDSTSLTSFSVATPLAGVPAPSPAGTVENLMVTGLESERTYYFALLVLDELDNTSLLSNVAVATTFDETAPSAVSDLVAFAPSGPSYMAMPLSAIASSGDISVAFGKDKAVDGLTATSWSTPGRMAMQVELLTVQLTGAGPSGVPVGRVRLCSRDVGNLFPIDFEIQVSLENASFATVVTRTGFAATAATCYPFEFTPVSSRYVRLRATKTRQYAPDQKFYAQLSELGVDQAVSHVDRVTLRWTAPGDNGSAGKAASYDIRYSTTTPFDFDTAVPIAGEPFPKPASSSETFDVVGLSAETQYTFGLKAADEAGNVSALSNVISGTTASIPPSPVSDLSASGATASSMNLQWTAPGDDGIVGTAASYDVRYSTAPIDTEGAASFSSAIQAVGEPAPGASGTMESMTVSGLAAGTLYYFALRVLDDSAAASLVSNVVSAATLDVTAPARVLDLSASVAELLQEIAVTAVSSTGDLQASYDKHKAVDDSAATSWSTPPRNTIQTELLVVDTGSANDLARVRLCARDVAGALFPQDFEIQISLDNVSYTTVVTKVSFVAANGACYPFDFAPQSARYVRLRVTKSRLYSGNLMYYVQLAELDVFELQELTDRITLAWTAPGDDGAAGTAASYDIRYSTSPIASDAELATATPVAGAPAPHAAGTAESFTVTGLSLGTEYHFAMKTNDESGNRSLLSNSPSVTTGSP